MYSSFISARSDTSQQVNKKYIKSLEDQIKIRQEERLELIKTLQKYQSNARYEIVLNQNGYLKAENVDLKTDYQQLTINQMQIDHLNTENHIIESMNQHLKLKKQYQKLQNQRNILKKANIQMISSLMFDQKQRQVQQLQKKLQISYSQIQKLNQKLKQTQKQNEILQQKLIQFKKQNEILQQKQIKFKKQEGMLRQKLVQLSNQRNDAQIIYKNNWQQLDKLKHKIQDQQKRLEYQRRQKQTIKTQLMEELQKNKNKLEQFKSLYQTLQKSYTEKMQSLQNNNQLQKCQFLSKIQQYQNIFKSKLFINKIKQISPSNQNTRQNSNQNKQNITNIYNTNLQSEHLINQYKQKISHLQNQLIEENKRLNILQQSNHELRRQLMVELQKQQQVRKMLIEQRKRSKSKQYFLQKQKSLKITDKYLSKSRSKDSKLQTSRSKFNSQKQKQKKEDNLSKIRKTIIGGKSLQDQNKLQKVKTNVINKVFDNTNKNNPSKRYANLNEENISNKSTQKENINKNQDQFQENVTTSLQTYHFGNKFTNTKKQSNHQNETPDIISARYAIGMIKTNNQEDVSYSKYRISSQSLDEKSSNNLEQYSKKPRIVFQQPRFEQQQNDYKQIQSKMNIVQAYQYIR